MRNLSKADDAARVPIQYLSYGVRLPLRVDLRDYAIWLIGNDPFASEKEVKRPATGLDTLESFYLIKYICFLVGVILVLTI